MLPLLLELPPAELITAHLTFPQLHTEWRHLKLTDLLRGVWEACYPALGDDIRPAPPSRQLTAVTAQASRPTLFEPQSRILSRQHHITASRILVWLDCDDSTPPGSPVLFRVWPGLAPMATSPPAHLAPASFAS